MQETFYSDEILAAEAMEAGVPQPPFLQVLRQTGNLEQGELQPYLS